MEAARISTPLAPGSGDGQVPAWNNTTKRYEPDSDLSAKLATIGQRYVENRAPLATDDSAAGFAVWDKWLDQAGGEAYICLDATEGTAIWELVSLDVADLADLFAEKIGGSTGSADNAILRADGTGGKTAQASGVTVDDDGNMTVPGSVSAASAVIGGKEISSQSGESTFAGQTGQTISITPVASANYHVEITPLAESGFIGEVWISTRTTNAFVVKNSGSDVSTAFAWQISGAALA